MDKNYIAIVFDGPPSHEAGRFVEVNDSHGKSIDIGTWVSRGDGSWELRIAVDKLKDDNDMTVDTSREAVQALIAELGPLIPADREGGVNAQRYRRIQKVLAALLDERDRLATNRDAWVSDAMTSTTELEQRIRDLEADLRKCGLRGEAKATEWREALERAERAEAERDAYKRAKAENDERFQIEAAEQRERADRLAAKLDAVKAFIANRSVIGGMDRMRLAAILADTDEGN